MTFDGATYHEPRDGKRLRSALDRAYELLSDHEPHTLAEIAAVCGCSESGASARIRDLRKPKFQERYPNGGVDSWHVGNGVWCYRMKEAVGAEKKQKVMFA